MPELPEYPENPEYPDTESEQFLKRDGILLARYLPRHSITIYNTNA